MACSGTKGSQMAAARMEKVLPNEDDDANLMYLMNSAQHSTPQRNVHLESAQRNASQWDLDFSRGLVGCSPDGECSQLRENRGDSFSPQLANKDKIRPKKNPVLVCLKSSAEGCWLPKKSSQSALLSQLS